MASNFGLIITADYPDGTAELRLLDDIGVQLAFRQTDFKTIPIGNQRALFDLRGYLDKYVDAGQEPFEIERIGVCIAEEVLGEEIFRLLWTPQAHRTLRIQLPQAGETENPLAAGLARVPWEIARPGVGKETLADRNLVVRVVHDMQKEVDRARPLEEGEPLRVLFVFAEARGSRPLAARLERRALRDLFEKKIYPKRRVVAHFLTHGVTRERLRAQIEENGGYHAVHWSGHGGANLLELAKPGGEQDRISGDELLDMFVQAGGLIPRLFFLSACHSGEILTVKDWNEFFDIASGGKKKRKAKSGASDARVEETVREAAVDTDDERDAEGHKLTVYATGEVAVDTDDERDAEGHKLTVYATATKEISVDQQAGYTGTAHALLQGGVASVVAMRYEVGDDYARELAVEFYDRLLAFEKPMNAAASLTMARRALLDPDKHDQSRYDPCDYATPLLYGAEDAGLELLPGRSPALKDTRDPRLHRIAELTMAEHEHFVGRTWELAGLGSDFIGSAESTSVKPVAVITGLGGMGKTALAAEALALWESRFQWVLLYQAKPNPLNFDATLRDVHIKLYGELGRYHDHVVANPADAIHRAADPDFTGEYRLDRLTRNLVRALRDEPILLVLDNFETNLKPKAEPGDESEPVWACQDPAWDRCLGLLASELRGTPSRVLITCRRPLAALSDADSHRVRLGPLPPGEAALYLRENKDLSKMVFGGDPAERELSMRLLTASRFHPLLMDRLARLAVEQTVSLLPSPSRSSFADAAKASGASPLRTKLLQALDILEQAKDYGRLPALFAMSGQKSEEATANELAYLDDALAASLDQLIGDASPDARRLLWMIAVANDPVTLSLLQSVWGGESYEVEQMRQFKQLFEMLPQLPPELQEQLKALPQEYVAQLDVLPEALERPDPAPLLGYLTAVGLVTEERNGPDDQNPDLACHELVRERIRAWMDGRPLDRGEFTENRIRLAYAERLEAVFEGLLHRNMTAALGAGSRTLVYCIQAGAYERLGYVAGVVTSASDPRLLASLIPHLESAAGSAPEGKPRWLCLRYLADALWKAGRPEASLRYYQQAAAQARAAAEAGGESAREAWADVGAITGNWANALRDVGDLDAARSRQLESAEAGKTAGRPLVKVIGSELEALRIDIMQGKHEEALPQVEQWLALVEEWWRRQRSGEEVREAPDPEYLARTLISALDIARQAHFAQEDWEAALRRIDSILEVQRALDRPAEDIAATRMNRAIALGCLRRFQEARAELEDCLRVFENNPAMKAKTLGSLASLFDDQGDVAQAIVQERRALALFEQLPDPIDRAISHRNLANYLANYLERSAELSALAESRRHQLADLVYCLVSGLGQDLKTSFHNYALDFRRAQDSGSPLIVPTLAELLSDLAFRPLAEWLGQRQVDLTDLQSAVDQFLAQARQLALSQMSEQEP